MLHGLLRFVELLRSHGIRISTQECMDASNAVAMVDIGNPHCVAAVLQTTLIKRSADKRTFHELFDLFFHQGLSVQMDSSPLVSLLRDAGLSTEAIEKILARIADEVNSLDQTARMLIGMRTLTPEILIRSANYNLEHIGSPLQAGYHTHALIKTLNIHDALDKINRMLTLLLDGMCLSPQDVSTIQGMVGQNVDRLQASVRQYIQQEFEKQHEKFIRTSSSLLEKPLLDLNDDETEALNDEVKRFIIMLRKKTKTRWKKQHRGRLDFRHLLRNSASTLGVPMMLRFHHRNRTKPRLLVLCDVSDSVRNVARFMLQFSYALQDRFDHVYSFAFVSELVETTMLFQESSVEEAINNVYQGGVVNVSSNSNYGRVFRDFFDNHIGKINKQTTVMIIGDGRNNYHPSHSAVLSDIRRRSKKTLWITPELPEKWNTGDSMMYEYTSYCDRTIIAYNLKTLCMELSELNL